MPAHAGKPTSSVWPFGAVAAILILSAAILRLVYLTHDCPLDLAPDEAHYWDWSRHLDWSYYSKGPLVAYLIRASCLLTGSWSRWLVGTDMVAVRLPAVVCGMLLLSGLYVLTAQIFKHESLALGVVALALTLPLLAAGATLMTIDAPYTCCWVWALVLGYHAVFRETRWAWPATGIVVGLGILAKYTMILWLPSLALFLIATPDRRRLVLRPGFWIMTGLSVVCCLPIVIWNAQHDWVSLRHLSGHAGLQHARIHWLGPFAFVAGQFLLLLGYWFVAWAGAMIHFRPWKDSRPEVAYLWWTSAPVFLFFLLCSLKNGGGELNWPVTAYVSGIVLVAVWLTQRMQVPGRLLLTFAGVILTAGLGLALTALMHNSSWAQPLLLRLAGPPTPQRPLPLRRLDPTCRLRGWRTLATEVDRLRSYYQSAGMDPVLAVARWDQAGELAFYCEGQPTVYCLGTALGQRHSQYDLWRPNPLADRQRFWGRTFIIVDGAEEQLVTAFDRLEAPLGVTHSERGQPIARWTIVVAHGFRGFPAARRHSAY
jgi:hypothetical protein